jgi:hypothetical protein
LLGALGVDELVEGLVGGEGGGRGEECGGVEGFEEGEGDVAAYGP